MYRIYMSFKITPKHTIFIILIGIFLILWVIKASWSYKEGLDSLSRLYTAKKDIANLPQVNIKDLKAKMAAGKTAYTLTKEGEDKLIALFIENEDKKKELKLRAEEIFNKILTLQKDIASYRWNIGSIQGALDTNTVYKTASEKNTAKQKLEDTKRNSSKAETDIDVYLDEYSDLDNKYKSWVKDEYSTKFQAILKDYKRPEADVIAPTGSSQVSDNPPIVSNQVSDNLPIVSNQVSDNPPIVSNQVSDNPPIVPEPATENMLKKPYIQDSAPDYPNYTFKGCWSSGNNTMYPILNKMVIPNVFNMNDCVKSISRAGLQSAAYDGKNLCFGGGSNYTEYTSSKCDDTYTKGKSWLVYSKNN